MRLRQTIEFFCLILVSKRDLRNEEEFLSRESRKLKDGFGVNGLVRAGEKTSPL